jgi:hypothetical protein
LELTNQLLDHFDWSAKVRLSQLFNRLLQVQLSQRDDFCENRNRANYGDATVGSNLRCCIFVNQQRVGMKSSTRAIASVSPRCNPAIASTLWGNRTWSQGGGAFAQVRTAGGER